VIRLAFVLLSLVLSTVALSAEGRQPTTFYRVTLQIELTNQTRRFEYGWKCEDRWDFVGRMYVRRPIADWPIAKDVGGDGVVLLSLPGNPCYPKLGDFRPDIGLFRNPSDPTSLEFYSGSMSRLYPDGGVIKGGQLEAAHSLPLRPNGTASERMVRDFWKQHRFEYFAIIGVVFPEEVWSTLPSLVDRFNGAKELILAESSAAYGSKAFPGTVITDEARSHLKLINLVFSAGIWTADDPQLANVIYFKHQTDPKYRAYRDIPIRYRGLTFRLEGGSQDVYDPAKRIMIRFLRVTPYPL
jgi:hypothetical protein